MIEKWKSQLLNVVEDIQESCSKFYDTLDDRVFYDSEETLKKNEYFLSTLSGFSLEQNVCFKKYLRSKGVDVGTPAKEDSDMDELINFLATL